MPERMFTMDEVADRLGLHVKTVRGYVREGRLKATRIGKQYRIGALDLANLTGRPPEDFEPEPINRERHIEVSSIVEIDAISPESVGRITNSVLGVTNARGFSESPLRVESVYDRQRGRLKLILIGDIDTTASLLKMIRMVLEG